MRGFAAPRRKVNCAWQKKRAEHRPLRKPANSQLGHGKEKGVNGASNRNCERNERQPKHRTVFYERLRVIRFSRSMSDMVSSSTSILATSVMVRPVFVLSSCA